MSLQSDPFLQRLNSPPARMLLALLLFFTAGTVWAEEPPDAPDRRAALRSGDIETRRDSAAYLGRHGDVQSVPALLDALRDREPGVRNLADNAIWSIWMRSGDAAIDEQMRSGAELLRMQRFDEALEIFAAVVKLRPDFAEGYNKRATALFYLGDYEHSLADIAETLKRNANHFGALSGAGLCWMALGDPGAALPYFQRALALNPNMTGVAETIQELKRRTKGRTL